MLALLVEKSDQEYTTEYAFALMSQMKRFTFTETDRLGKRKAHRLGFPGIACMYCFGGNGTGRYFPSSIKTFADVSKTLNVLHGHLIRCKGCPMNAREKIEGLKQLHQKEKDAMAFGSQKIFFDIVWNRLHFVSEEDRRNKGNTCTSQAEASFGQKLNIACTTSSGECSRACSSAFTIDDVANIMTTTLCKAPVIWQPEKRQTE